MRTPETAKRILEAVSKGVPYGLVARLAGISFSTFCDWRNDDPNFQAELDEALATSVERRLEIIRDSAATDWRCAAWFLEHVLPEHFAKTRIQVEALGQFDHSFSIPPETLRQIAEARARHEQLNGNTTPALPIATEATPTPAPDERTGN